MLKERKCLMCKHHFDSKTFEHKCKAYPEGIPQKYYDEDTYTIDCGSKEYHFEYKNNIKNA